MKKSTLHTRSVSGFVFLFLLLLTLFAGQASAADTKTEELLEIAGGAGPEEVRQLIQGGADVNAKNNLGWTPLMLAAYNNSNLATLTALLDAGADAKAKNNEGKTALDYARMNEKLKDTEALRLLEEKTGQN